MRNAVIRPRFKSYYIFVICFILIGSGFLYLGTNLKTSNEKALVFAEIDWTDVGKHKEGLGITMTTKPSWKGLDGMTGTEYDGVIVNHLNQEITDWRIDITTFKGSKIDSLWNGVYTLQNNHLVIKAMDYNPIIKANSEEGTFGFVMYTNEGVGFEKIRIEGYRVYELRDFPLFWMLVVASGITLIVLAAYLIAEYRISRYKVKQAEDQKMIIQSLNTFANFIDAKDSYTKGHSTRVAHLSKEIARRLGLKTEEQENLYYIALLHDVGKVGVRNEILDKPGKLTEDERIAIQMHTVIGADILKDFTALHGISEGARFHHEWYDGSGYPNGLSKIEIPLYARIICVADAYDAMSSDRYYRNRLSEETIVGELESGSGSQFDPEIVHHMLDMIAEGCTKEICDESVC